MNDKRLIDDLVSVLVKDVMQNLPKCCLENYLDPSGRSTRKQLAQIGSAIEEMGDEDALVLNQDITDSGLFAGLNQLSAELKQGITVQLSKEGVVQTLELSELTEAYRSKVEPGGHIV